MKTFPASGGQRTLPLPLHHWVQPHLRCRPLHHVEARLHWASGNPCHWSDVHWPWYGSHRCTNWQSWEKSKILSRLFQYKGDLRLQCKGIQGLKLVLRYSVDCGRASIGLFLGIVVLVVTIISTVGALYLGPPGDPSHPIPSIPSHPSHPSTYSFE